MNNVNTLTCLRVGCTNTFKNYKSVKKFCSVECRKEDQELQKATKEALSQLLKTAIPHKASHKKCLNCHASIKKASIKKKYCSATCRTTAAHQRHISKHNIKPKRYEVNCVTCQKEFIAKRSDARVCSTKCNTRLYYKTHKSAPVSYQKVCIICEKEFTGNRVDAKCCGQKCNNISWYNNRKNK